MIRGLSGTAIDIAESESGLGREDEDGQLQGHVKDLEHGVKQGGKVTRSKSLWSGPGTGGFGSLHAPMYLSMYVCSQLLLAFERVVSYVDFLALVQKIRGGGGRDRADPTLRNKKKMEKTCVVTFICSRVSCFGGSESGLGERVGLLSDETSALDRGGRGGGGESKAAKGLLVPAVGARERLEAAVMGLFFPRRLRACAVR